MESICASIIFTKGLDTVAEIKLGDSDLMQIASLIAIDPNICCVLAQSLSSDIRREIARNDNLSNDILTVLSEDNSIYVCEELCTNDAFRNWASTETLVNFINRDPSLARSIASRVGDFVAADRNALKSKLVAHPDSSVRAALLSYWNLSPDIIERLVSDPDASVARAARELREYKSFQDCEVYSNSESKSLLHDNAVDELPF